MKRGGSHIKSREGKACVTKGLQEEGMPKVFHRNKKTSVLGHLFVKQVFVTNNNSVNYTYKHIPAFPTISETLCCKLPYKSQYTLHHNHK